MQNFVHRCAAMVIALAGVIAAPGAAVAATLTLSSVITVDGVDVTSGPTFLIDDTYTADDYLALRVDGTVDLAWGDFTANAAGIILSPQTTNTNAHPGQITIGPNGAPYGALLIGNGTLGFVPFFTVSAANGLGGPTPLTELVEYRTFSSLFGTGVTAGTVLQFRVNDDAIYTYDNSGAFQVSPVVPTPVPEPASLLLLGAGLSALAVRRRRSRSAGAMKPCSTMGGQVGA